MVQLQDLQDKGFEILNISYAYGDDFKYVILRRSVDAMIEKHIRLIGEETHNMIKQGYDKRHGHGSFIRNLFSLNPQETSNLLKELGVESFVMFNGYAQVEVINYEKLIQDELDQFFEYEKSLEWWQLPNNELQNKTPTAMVEEGKGQVVLDMLRNFAR